MRTFLADEFLPEHPNVQLYAFEVYFNPDNADLWQKVAANLGGEALGVPYLVIGDKTIEGFGESTTPQEIEDRVNYCLQYGCPDVVMPIINPQTTPTPTPASAVSVTSTPTPTPEDKKLINIPLVGDIDAFHYSLPLLTIFLGILDGFNPCAMWTLLFLISLLLGFKDRKKMWLLGGVFIVTSAFVYFLFMTAWLNIFLIIGYKRWLNILIALIALVGGMYGVRSYFKNRSGGCEIAGNEKRQATFERLKNIVKHHNLWLALGGIVLLAAMVNLVELLCSTGFPAVYTKALTLSHLATWQYYAYILLYIFFFMLDDLIIFAIAMITLKVTGISTKYGRISKLVGGIAMIIIGLLLVFKPEWLTFS